ncbi:MAG TPA: hypothetical protein VL357_03130 [Rariglobus sp.]|jgi:hypothetical protein|nr:hypothetical protein [Rariglobus sp.]
MKDKSCTVLDRAEFARRIRKHKNLYIAIRDYDGRSITGFFIPANLAVTQLLAGSFDELTWSDDEAGPDVAGDRAPAHIVLSRQIEMLTGKLSSYEHSAANASTEANREWSRSQAEKYRREINLARTKLAAHRAQPVAA